MLIPISAHYPSKLSSNNMSSAVSESIRRVGTHAQFLALFGFGGVLLNGAANPRMAAYAHWYQAPTILMFANIFSIALMLLGVYFWLSTSLAMVKAVRSLNAHGLKTSWSWIIPTVVPPFALLAALAFYFMKHKFMQDSGCE